MLIGQGANDPRVKQAEADQIAFAMADKVKSRVQLIVESYGINTDFHSTTL